jgi:hypothetical protein
MAKSAFAKFMKAFMVSAKAVPESEIDKFVEDYTDDEHRIPTEEEIKFGPTEASSGEGAVRMTKEYSNPAPQQAITEEYIEFNRMIDKRVASIGKAVEQQGKILAGVVSFMQKAVSTDQDDTGDEAEENAALTTKAVVSMKKARKSILKAEMDDEDEGNEEREEEVIRAEKALAVAKKAIEKAEEDDEEEEGIEKALETFKSLTKRVKSLRKAIPNDKDDKGNQDDKIDPESGNQKDGSAKSMKDMIKETLTEMGLSKAAEAAPVADTSDVNKSLSIINMNLAQLFDAVAGKSQAAGAPVFQKSDAQAILKSKMDSVQSAIDNEELNDTECARAETLLSHMRAAQDGVLDHGTVVAEIAKAGSNIQRLFAA